MSIKSDMALVRGLLYLHDVCKLKTINKAAEVNGIKPSNLSLLLSDLEKQLNAKLLIRTPQGCVPTAYGKLFFNLAIELKTFISEIKNTQPKTQSQMTLLKVFIAPNLDFCDYFEFEKNFPEIHIQIIKNIKEADFLILNSAPSDSDMTYSVFNIGTHIIQKIWLCCYENNCASLLFFDFIVAQLLTKCAQLKPLSLVDSYSPDAK